MKSKILSLRKLIDKYNLHINIILIATGLLGLFLFGLEIYNNEQVEAIGKVDESEVYAQKTEEIESQYIDIEGQVVNPGVYEIKRGDTLISVINLAGGYTEVADTNYVQMCLNLAEKMKDEQKIYVPAKDEKFSCNDNALSEISLSKTSGKISLNNATQEELESLSGIGPSTAEKIVDGRPYSKLEDLMNVKGIGEATFEKIKNDITL
jgi:competence protein ComEA